MSEFWASGVGCPLRVISASTPAMTRMPAATSSAVPYPAVKAPPGRRLRRPAGRRWLPRWRPDGQTESDANLLGRVKQCRGDFCLVLVNVVNGGLCERYDAQAESKGEHEHGWRQVQPVAGILGDRGRPECCNSAEKRCRCSNKTQNDGGRPCLGTSAVVAIPGGKAARSVERGRRRVPTGPLSGSPSTLHR